MTDSIIVYRNPIEAALYESVTSADGSTIVILFNILLIFICTVALLVLVTKLVSKYGKFTLFSKLVKNYPALLIALLIVPGFFLAKLIKLILVIGIPTVFDMIIMM